MPSVTTWLRSVEPAWGPVGGTIDLELTLVEENLLKVTVRDSGVEHEYTPDPNPVDCS